MTGPAGLDAAAAAATAEHTDNAAYAQLLELDETYARATQAGLDITDQSKLDFVKRVMAVIDSIGDIQLRSSDGSVKLGKTLKIPSSLWLLVSQSLHFTDQVQQRNVELSQELETRRQQQLAPADNREHRGNDRDSGRVSFKYVFKDPDTQDFIAFVKLFDNARIANKWSDEEAKQFMFNAFAEPALRSVMHHTPQAFHGGFQDYQAALEGLLYPQAGSGLAYASFRNVRQDPREPLAAFHARVSGLYRRANPKTRLVGPDAQLALIQAFAEGLVDPEIRKFVQERNPQSFEEARIFASQKAGERALAAARNDPSSLGASQAFPAPAPVVTTAQPSTTWAAQPSSSQVVEPMQIGAVGGSGPKRCFACPRATSHTPQNCFRLRDALRALAREQEKGTGPQRPNNGESRRDVKKQKSFPRKKVIAALQQADIPLTADDFSLDQLTLEDDDDDEEQYVA